MHINPKKWLATRPTGIWFEKLYPDPIRPKFLEILKKNSMFRQPIFFVQSTADDSLFQMHYSM